MHAVRMRSQSLALVPEGRGGLIQVGDIGENEEEVEFLPLTEPIPEQEPTQLPVPERVPAGVPA